MSRSTLSSGSASKLLRRPLLQEQAPRPHLSPVQHPPFKGLDMLKFEFFGLPRVQDGKEGEDKYVAARDLFIKHQEFGISDDELKQCLDGLHDTMAQAVRSAEKDIGCGEYYSAYEKFWDSISAAEAWKIDKKQGPSQSEKNLEKSTIPSYLSPFRYTLREFMKWHACCGPRFQDGLLRICFDDVDCMPTINCPYHLASISEDTDSETDSETDSNKESWLVKDLVRHGLQGIRDFCMNADASKEVQKFLNGYSTDEKEEILKYLGHTNEEPLPIHLLD